MESPRLLVASRALLAVVSWLAACTGTISGPPDHGTGGGEPGAGGGSGGGDPPLIIEDELPADPPRGDLEPGPVTLGEGRLSVTPRRIRRLTPLEYSRTVENILGRNAAYAAQFPSDPTVFGFHNFGNALEMRPLLTENLWTGVKSWLAAAPLESLLKCDNRNDELGCVRQTFRQAARTAYHREATDADLAELVAVYQTGRTGSTFDSGVRLAYEVLLQSPYTMFRTELGGEPNEFGYVTLTEREIANQLAFLLTASPPDEELLTAAANGELTSASARADQVRRLLAGASAQAALTEFARGWLMLETLRFDQKNTAVFPQFTTELKDRMKSESLAFVARALGDGTAGASDLFAGRQAHVDAAMAQFYGVAAPGGSYPATVELPPERGGILGRASLLSTLAHSAYGSPVMRGAFIRRRLLCESIPDPPPDINASVPAVPPQTTRELFAEHSRNPTCAVCHAVMDELGFPFEVFDGIGRMRTSENGHPIDARGSFEVADTSLTVNGPVELTQALAQSPEAHACFARNWLRHISAREETEDEGTWSAAIGARSRAGELDLRDLVLATVTSQTFILRAAQ